MARRTWVGRVGVASVRPGRLLRSNGSDDIVRGLERRVLAGDLDAVVPLAQAYERVGRGQSPVLAPKQMEIFQVDFSGERFAGNNGFDRVEAWLDVYGFLDDPRPDISRDGDGWSAWVWRRPEPSNFKVRTRVQLNPEITLHLTVLAGMDAWLLRNRSRGRA